MDNTQKKLPDRIAFIADAHLGMPGDVPARSEKVADFLRWLNGKVSHLYIVGDLFDFWFEYKSVVPNVSPHVIFELYNLVQAGTKIVIFAGNHDFWLGQYLRKDVGLDIATDELTVEHQNKKIYIHHGDGLHPEDHGYRILKKILRNKLSIYLFSFLHPDHASWLAKVTSKSSRDYLSSSDIKSTNISIFRKIADKHLKNNFDAVVYGHTHVPLVEERPDGTFILLGDWITNNTYIFLENGNFIINNWKPGKEP